MYNYKTDCFWLNKSRDMSATIFFCDWHTTENNEWVVLDKCPSNCKYYINIDEAKTVINSWQNNRK